ncbi:CotH kinase family protein [Thermopolyspora sp. NPDC052614]|uniref:CotH kinase family protein n=1 Tax=Thermopolyspora sp. NPDC052614 TaxID=3155682 RepID=UPI003422A0C6
MDHPTNPPGDPAVTPVTDSSGDPVPGSRRPRSGVRRRLRHRIPVSLRHNWRLVALCVAFLAICGGVFGTGTIRPYVVEASAAGAEPVVVQDIAGKKDLFDGSTSHEITLTFADESYRDMLDEYFATGEKEYVEADLVIDGTRIPSVGIRLKGNSTLSGLTWNGQSRRQLGGGGPGMRQPGDLPEGGQRPEGAARPEGAPQFGGGGAGPRGGMFGSLKGEEPENLPWLISFDEFVEGRRYQGRSQIAVRPAAGTSTTLLNEALAISLVGAAGEPTQRYAYSSFSVNGRSSTPRLVVEYLDEGYAERLGNGVLYKSLASSGFTYKGEDQTQYGTDFKQVNKVGGKDLQPVIDLIKWVEQSSDVEFAAGLADRLDVESFARYIALQNILLNFDDMSGPGRNYYLWYDLDTKKFTVIAWDLNFALSGDATAGPYDTIGMGFGPGRQRAQGQGQAGQGQPGQGQAGQTQAGQRPTGQGAAGRAAQGVPRMGHVLKERFLQTPDFKAVYEEQYRALYRELLGDGTATGLLNEIVTSYKHNKGADQAKIDAEATSLRTLLAARAKALAANEVVSGA